MLQTHTTREFHTTHTPRSPAMSLQTSTISVAAAVVVAVAAGAALHYFMSSTRESQVQSTNRSTVVVRIFRDLGDAAEAIADLAAKTLSAENLEVSSIEPMAPTCTQDISNATTTLLLFVVECDKEGDSSCARKLMRSLKAAQAPSLIGVQVAVLALAKSVCAFSAASGGDDKFMGGHRLLKSLQAAGAEAICKVGHAEVEVEEVEVSVIPWLKEVASELKNWEV